MAWFEGSGVYMQDVNFVCGGMKTVPIFRIGNIKDNSENHATFNAGEIFFKLFFGTSIKASLLLAPCKSLKAFLYSE